jgi:4-amino-4-deoxy-L-arabinose transferase-like glycosyltransferase
MPPRITLPPSRAALAAIAALFILPGLAGHDLWKSQDAIGLGIVHGMAVSGDLIVPRIAGNRWLYDPPLYHWVALAFGRLLGPFIEFHGAARLASGVFVGAAFMLIYRAARRWSDPELSRTTACGAFLVLLGCIGLLVHTHEALPELAALTAMCGALGALPFAARAPAGAGAAIGLALGLAFLAGGWMAPLALAAAVGLAHFVCAEWRTRRGVVFIAIAAPVAVLVALTWPLALAARAPDAFAEWRTIVTQGEGTVAANFRHFFATASWFTWPAWPLAAWTAWSLRARWREARLFVPAVAALALIALLILWGPPADENLLPLLAPLSLVAAHGIFSLRRGASAALDWFGALTFAVFAIGVWLGYIAMLTGLPAPMARNFARIAPGYVTQVHVLAIIFALLLAAAWVYLVLCTAPSPLRSVTRWAGGMVLLWGTFAALWMPWVDYQKSYRSVALQLKSKLPVGAPCLAERNLGVSQSAALDYHGGIRAQPYDVVKPAACPLVLVQGSPQHELDAPGGAGLRWRKLADVGRPGDRAERYRLYRLDR